MKLRHLFLTLSFAAGLIFFSLFMGNTKPTCQKIEPQEPVCMVPSDCEGLDHPMCLGKWQCIEATCVWECGNLTKECSSDADCDEGEYCDFSNCEIWATPEDGESMPIPPDCKGVCKEKGEPSECVVTGCSGEICAEEPMVSTCVYFEWYQCLKYSECGNYGPEGSCGWKPTPEYLKCLKEHNGPIPEGYGECITDSDCDSGEYCSTQDGDCLHWIECPMCEVCAGNCVKKSGKIECNSDADCPEGYVCEEIDFQNPESTEMNGICVPEITGECLDDSDCDPGYKCEIKEICPNEIDPDDCTDPECGGICEVYGECVPINEGECQTDEDCPDGKICEFDTVCDEPECDNNGNCWGSCTIVGKCVDKPEPECASDAECPYGYYCNASEVCLPAPGCENGEEPCIDLCYGYCLPAENKACADDSDCPEGMFCKTECPPCDSEPCPMMPCYSHCAFKDDQGKKCKSDKDCADNEVCGNMVCIDCVPGYNGDECGCFGECIPKEEPNKCMVTGCSGQVCAEEPVYTTCEWLPWYECFKYSECGPYGENGTCDWKKTEKFKECMESYNKDY